MSEWEIPLEIWEGALYQLLNEHVRSLMERDGEFPIKRPTGSPEWMKMIHLYAVAGGKAAKDEHLRQTYAAASLRTFKEIDRLVGLCREDDNEELAQFWLGLKEHIQEVNAKKESERNERMKAQLQQGEVQ